MIWTRTDAFGLRVANVSRVQSDCEGMFDEEIVWDTLGLSGSGHNVQCAVPLKFNATNQHTPRKERESLGTSPPV